jgi:hypothetical protein
MSYDSVSKKMSVYNQAGKLVSSYTITLDPVLSAPVYVRLAEGSVIDEFVMYNRVISDYEIRSITQMRIPPDVRSNDHTLIASPDGSRYKITVGNDGALTTTKL